MKLTFRVVALGLTVVAGVGHADGPGGSRGAARVGVGATAPVAADSSGAIFLSWGAPYGMPGARDAITSSCGDTTMRDTLYITFDPGRNQDHLIGIDANLMFHAAPGDTLGPFWGSSKPGPFPPNIRVQVDDPPDGCPSPWQGVTTDVKKYRKSGDLSELVLVRYTAVDEAGPVQGGTRYFIARVLLGHRGGDWGCDRPVCAALARLKPSYGPGSPWITTGERFVTWNSPGGAACSKYRLELDALLHPPAPDTTRK
jgi:hypothetical protein